ncbi:IclR family transcriptional regulator C-terminal domain-containing protein [Streptomyces sp. NPDC006706]|uniref:IclR family transcriptional regulator domain-containing protein n=1 Tax=Streptomyces sp. NPDC006706 TaxID=3364761 RepID=UPI0036B55A88
MRRNGFAVNKERSERSLVAVGVPVRNQDGTSLAVLSVSMPGLRYDLNRLQSRVAALDAAAHALEEGPGRTVRPTTVSSWIRSRMAASLSCVVTGGCGPPAHRPLRCVPVLLNSPGGSFSGGCLIRSSTPGTEPRVRCTTTTTPPPPFPWPPCGHPAIRKVSSAPLYAHCAQRNFFANALLPPQVSLPSHHPGAGAATPR